MALSVSSRLTGPEPVTVLPRLRFAPDPGGYLNDAVGIDREGDPDSYHTSFFAAGKADFGKRARKERRKESEKGAPPQESSRFRNGWRTDYLCPFGAFSQAYWIASV